MTSRSVIRNAKFAVFQVVVTGVALFVLYRFLVQTLGIEAVGVFSVTFALTGAVRVADLGIGGGVTRFVARSLGEGDPKQAAQYVETATTTLAAGFLIMALVMTYILARVIPAVIADGAEQAMLLLPYAVASFWLSSVAAVFQAGLDGVHRMDLRSSLAVCADVAKLLAVLALVPRIGIAGLGYASVIQHFIVLAGSWVLLKKELSALRGIPVAWSFPHFRAMVGYGARLQVMSVSRLLFEPTTKTLLAYYGGTATAGYYEMASRAVVQVRALLVSASQAIVPAIAGVQVRSVTAVSALYGASYRLVFACALPIFGMLMAIAPLLSMVWLGSYVPEFVIIVWLLSVGWAINALSASAYFAGLGSGQLRWNVAGHVAIAGLTAFLGVVLGSRFGGAGVVVGSATALALGSIIAGMGFHAQQGAPDAHFRNLIPRESHALLTCCIGGLGASAAFFVLTRGRIQLTVAGPLCMIIFTMAVAWPLWNHPLLRSMAESLLSRTVTPATADVPTALK